MKKLNKVTIILIFIILVQALMPLAQEMLNLKSMAVSDYKDSYGVTYHDNDETICLKDYPKNGPSTYNIPEGTDGIWSTALEKAMNLKVLNIPSSMRYMHWDGYYDYDNEGFVGESWPYMMALVAPYITEYNVNTNNQWYMSEDGIVYTKDKRELVKYPAGKTATKYTVDSSVKKISHGAFAINPSYTTTRYLKEVIIPYGVEEIGMYAFSNIGITKVYIPRICYKNREGCF